MNEIGLERLCVFGMPPVEFVRLTAALGCRCIGIGLTPIRKYNPQGYPDWSLRDDAALRRETVAALQGEGVRISLLEGFGVAPGREVLSFARDLDLAAELGAERINVVSMDRDMLRTLDGFARFAEMGAERGLQVSTEIGPGPIATLGAAMTALRHVARPNFTLLIDTMHFFRFGSTVEDLAAVPPEAIGYVQLCDAPLASRCESYMDEALHERMTPGEGELPLRELLALVPEDVVVSLEVPQRSLAEQGVGAAERTRRCVEAARGMLGA